MSSAGMVRDPDGRGITFNGSLSSLSRGGGAAAAGIPQGWEERRVYLYCKDEKLACTILVKSNTEEDTTILDPQDYLVTEDRKLLQVNCDVAHDGELVIDKGYLA